MDVSGGGFELYLIIGVAWLSCALLAFLNGLVRRLHTWQWLAVSVLLGPLALAIGLFLHGRGRRVSLFARRPPEPSTPVKPVDPLARLVFTSEIADLKRQGRFDEAIEMLVVLVETVEEKSHSDGRPVPHWYYEQLANLYRRQARPKDELRTLRRYASQRHAEGSHSRRLLARLEQLGSPAAAAKR